MPSVVLSSDFLRGLLPERPEQSHKGTYGHLLVVAGCETMPGAAVLATGAALKSGCGLVTLHSTARALQAAVNNFPSAMLSEEPERVFSTLPADLSKFSAIAVGPGLDQRLGTLLALRLLMQQAGSAGIPMLLDADALNLLSANPELREFIPAGSVLTPHPGELGRLLSGNPAADRDEAIWEWVNAFDCTVVVKGYRTEIFRADGCHYVNPTGNPGLAKGGSGDVLTGLVGGLMARGIPPRDAALLGVWIHGYAGDALSARCTPEAYSSRDLIDALFEGFKTIL